MNQDSQDLPTGNPPASDPEQVETATSSIEDQLISILETSSSLYEQESNFPTMVPPYTASVTGHIPVSDPEQPEIAESSIEDQLESTLERSSFQQARNFENVLSRYITSFSGNIPVSVPEQPANTENYIGNQLASTSEVSNTLSQPTRNFSTIYSPDIATFFGNFPVSTPEQPENTASYIGHQLASTSELSNTLSQPTRNFSTSYSPDIASFSGNFPVSAPEQPANTTSYIGDQLASTSEGSSSFSNQTRISPTSLSSCAASLFGNIPASLSEQAEITESHTEVQRPSTSEGSSSISLLKNMYPTLAFLLGTEFPLNQRTDISKNQETAVSPRQQTEAFSPSKQQATSLHHRQKTGSRSSPVEKASPSKQQAAAVRHIQKTGARASPAKKTSPSTKQATAAHPRYRRSLSDSVEKTSGSRRELSAVGCRERAKTLSSIDMPSASGEQVTSVNPRRQLWPSSIPGEPKMELVYETWYKENRHPEFVDMASSPEKETTDPCDMQNESSEESVRKSSISQQQPNTSSRESPSEDPFIQHSVSIPETEMEVVGLLDERLVLFDKFICVNCLAEFATQDELLNHEPIHFYD